MTRTGNRDLYTIRNNSPLLGRCRRRCWAPDRDTSPVPASHALILEAQAYTPSSQPGPAGAGTRWRQAMSVRLFALVLVFIAAPLWAVAQSSRADDKPAVYYPDAVWQHKTPTESGLDPARLKEATDFAAANESKSPRDLALNHYQTFGREPFGYPIGPIKDRGDPTGLVIHHGYIVAEWGEPKRVTWLTA